MLVENIASSLGEQALKNTIEDSPDESGGVLIFKRQLSSETAVSYEKQIKSLIAGIEQQGAVLCSRADMGEMQKYRGMITRLMNETVSNGYAFFKEGRFGTNGRNRVFAVVRKINEKLDEMTQKVLLHEKQNLDLLNDVDDIRGLLVDLYF